MSKGSLIAAAVLVATVGLAPADIHGQPPGSTTTLELTINGAFAVVPSERECGGASKGYRCDYLWLLAPSAGTAGDVAKVPLLAKTGTDSTSLQLHLPYLRVREGKICADAAGASCVDAGGGVTPFAGLVPLSNEEVTLTPSVGWGDPNKGIHFQNWAKLLDGSKWSNGGPVQATCLAEPVGSGCVDLLASRLKLENGVVEPHHDLSDCQPHQEDCLKPPIEWKLQYFKKKNQLVNLKAPAQVLSEHLILQSTFDGVLRVTLTNLKDSATRTFFVLPRSAGGPIRLEYLQLPADAVLGMPPDERLKSNDIRHVAWIYRLVSNPGTAVWPFPTRAKPDFGGRPFCLMTSLDPK